MVVVATPSCAGRVVGAQVDVEAPGLARWLDVAEDEIITLGVAAVHGECISVFAGEEHRGAYTDDSVARIDANAVVGGLPGDRQVRAVIYYAGDLPDELLTLGRRSVSTPSKMMPPRPVVAPL